MKQNNKSSAIKVHAKTVNYRYGSILLFLVTKLGYGCSFLAALTPQLLTAEPEGGDDGEASPTGLQQTGWE